VVYVSWYGAAAFCNWLSEMEGLTPCYDMTTANWPLKVAPPASGGYRLPTEAEWERAAAWDGTKHWVYGFTSDTLAGNDQVNYHDDVFGLVNPLGFVDFPYTSPVGWFNGVNVSPNGNTTTQDSASPAGCYDMSGNVWQWCQDWYGTYNSQAQTNPLGVLADGEYRVARGGSWRSAGDNYCRSAGRNSTLPSDSYYFFGFRLAKS
jgi:formylglycine-generating enzyme required for sulfatase activity